MESNHDIFQGNENDNQHAQIEEAKENKGKATHFSLIDKNYKFTVIPTKVEEQVQPQKPINQGGANDALMSAAGPGPNETRIQPEKVNDSSSRAFPKVDSANDISKLPSVNVVFRRLSLALDEGIEKKLNGLTVPMADNIKKTQLIVQKSEDAKVPEERSGNNQPQAPQEERAPNFLGIDPVQISKIRERNEILSRNNIKSGLRALPGTPASRR